MNTNQKEIIHKIFGFSLILKALNAILEIIGGGLFGIISLEKINYFLFFLFQGELSEDPNDFITSHLVNFFKNLSVPDQVFGSFYLISHGIIKILLVIALWKRKLWAYPLATVIFSIFIAYQLLRYSWSHSFGLIILTVIDIFLIIFIQLEYRRLKSIGYDHR